MNNEKLYPIRLEYEDFHLYVNWALPDGEFERIHSVLLHKFQAGTEPDLLFEYLILKANGRLVTKKQLIGDRVISRQQLNFTRVFTEQVRFNPLLKKIFVERLRPSEVQLKVRSSVSELDLHKLSNYLKSLPHSGTTRHKNTVHFRLPSFPSTD